MTNSERALLEMAARMLAHEDREVVLGDLSEAGASAGQGVLEISGLAARRLAALWLDWRPWLAAFGLALPGTLLLEGVSVSISCTYERLIGNAVFGVCSPTGQEGSLLLLCHILLLGLWSWTGGFVVGTVSRRTLWASVAIALCPCVYCFTRFHDASMSPLCLLLFAPPAILGIRHGLRCVRIKPHVAIAVAGLVTVLTICAWLNGALWAFNWALLVPAWYMVALALQPGGWQVAAGKT
jgi:hypothetical protein